MKGADFWITAQLVEVGPGIIRSPRKVSANTYRELEAQIPLLGKLLIMSGEEYHKWQEEMVNHPKLIAEAKTAADAGLWEESLNAYTRAFVIQPSAEARDGINLAKQKIEEEKEAKILSVPPEFRAKLGTKPEPYKNTGWAKEIIHDETGIEMVFIPAGSLRMGSMDDGMGRDNNKGLVHKVRIAKPFYMGKYEVTQRQWQKVMGSNPSYFKKDDQLPVECDSWNDCQEFCRRLGAGFRLPSEAEWEYACRAGTQTRFYFGDDDFELGKYAWYDDNSAW